MSVLLLQLGFVTVSLITLLAFPAFPLSVLLTGKKTAWPEVLLTAVILGCGSQAAIGLVWSHLIGQHPGREALVYFLLWGLISLALSLLRRSCLLSWQPFLGTRFHFLLLLILVSAFVVRSIHPLQTAALGQSDAYTHLHYLHYIVDQGRLFNIIYPAGYHWVLSLPIFVFGLDPYWIARFSGAFFGTALVLAIYVFLHRLFGRRAAIFGSFCSACFPGMMLLMKTGVGAFANQLGLFLVPCILYFYYRIINQEEDNQEKDNQAGSRILLLIACLGLGASVPMMLIHIFIIFVIERLVTLVRKRKKWLWRTTLLVLLCLPSVLLVAFHFFQAGSGQRFQTAEVLMKYGGQEKMTTEKIVNKVQKAGAKYSYRQSRLVKLVVASPYFHLLVDLFMVKRLGFSNVYIDLLGGTLFLLYVSFLTVGLYSGKVSLILLGIWGVLTTVQAGTGFLQFSSYQREGWSLLIATCCLSGVIAGRLYGWLGNYRVIQVGTIAGMSALAWWTLQNPPRHPVLHSSAEDLLVRTVRFFSRNHEKILEECGVDNNSVVCKTSQLFVEKLPMTIVTRRFVGWHNQGEIVPNVMPQGSPVTSVSVDPKGMKEQFVFDRQYLVLIDRVKFVQPSEVISAFAMVAPSQVVAALSQQKYLYQANEKILSYISNLPQNEWQVRREVLSLDLTAYIVTPVAISL